MFPGLLFVVQRDAFTLATYDRMIRIEDELIRKLREDHEVDGHDAGTAPAENVWEPVAPDAERCSARRD